MRRAGSLWHKIAGVATPQNSPPLLPLQSHRNQIKVIICSASCKEFGVKNVNIGFMTPLSSLSSILIKWTQFLFFFPFYHRHLSEK